MRFLSSRLGNKKKWDKSRFMKKQEEHGYQQSAERWREGGKKEKGKHVIDESKSFSGEVTSESVRELTVAAGDWQVDKDALFIKLKCRSCLSHLKNELITGTEMLPEDRTKRCIGDLFQMTKRPIHVKVWA